MQTKRAPQPRRDKKHLTSVALDHDQVRRLDEIASARRASRSQLCREAIELYLADYAKNQAA